MTTHRRPVKLMIFALRSTSRAAAFAILLATLLAAWPSAAVPNKPEPKADPDPVIVTSPT